jgi:hypothetical protein
MDALDSLEERRQKLEERRKQIESTPLQVMRLDLLKRIINDLETDPQALELFGPEPLKHMAIVFDETNDEILIADANIGELNVDNELKFVRFLRDIIKKETKE